MALNHITEKLKGLFLSDTNVSATDCEATGYISTFYPVVDAAASTAITERVIYAVSADHAGLAKEIKLVGAVIAADNTDYITLTVAVRRAADYTTAVTLGTYDSRAANQGALVAFTPKSFSLTVANLALTAGDVITFTEAKGGSGKSVSGGVLIVIQKK
jgi:hypothetical protein